MAKPIEICTAPHLKRLQSVEQIMRNVVYALLPVAAFSVWQFGISALALILTTTVVAMLTERLFSQLAGRGNTLGDWSVVISGLLLALTLPPGFPLWMAAVAAFVAVALGKALFGGLGFNVMNPALVGRAFVQAAFPVAITTWTPAFAPGRFGEFIPSTLAVPFMKPESVTPWVNGLNIDGFTGATPLAMQKFQHITDQYQRSAVRQCDRVDRRGFGDPDPGWAASTWHFAGCSTGVSPLAYSRALRWSPRLCG